jgi:RHS repeat-associated protein
VTQTKSPGIQTDDFYAHGMSAQGYQRESSFKNNFVYNGGSEVQTSVDANIYGTFFRSYDASIGRFMQVDPMAVNFSSHTPYNFAFNDPVSLNDPMGDLPRYSVAHQISDRNNGTYDYEDSYENDGGGGFDNGMTYGYGGGNYDPYLRGNNYYTIQTPTEAWNEHLVNTFGGSTQTADVSTWDYFTNGDRKRYINTEVRWNFGANSLNRRVSKQQAQRPTFEGGVMYSDVAQGLQDMWSASGVFKGEYRENLAVFTSQGLLVLPNTNNSRNNSKQSLAFFSLRFVDNKPQINWGGKDNWLPVLGVVHTHPDPSGYQKHAEYWESPGDWLWTKGAGLSHFVISTTGIYEGTYDGSDYISTFVGPRNAKTYQGVANKYGN